jgi:hypothetical protein
MTSRARRIEELGPFAAGALLLVLLLTLWWSRLTYPFDLEWMEGGMLAHAWRLDQGLQLYVRPNLDFVPYVYPPGYSAVVALLGKVFGLSMGLGRAVSVVSILAAAAILGRSLAQTGAERLVLWGAPLVFLGTYPMVGAFYDLVRPDSLAVALLAGSLVLSLDTERRWAPTAAGLLLAAAFLTKQNTAIFGVPVAVALVHRDWRDGARFVAASLGPALVAVAALQWWSSGRFLTWMLDVPRSHPSVWQRAVVDVPREWGMALPVAFAVVGFAWVIDAVRRQSMLPAPVAALLPLWAGLASVAFGLRNVSNDGTAPLATGFAYWAGVAGPVALAVVVIGLVAGAVRALISEVRDPELAGGDAGGSALGAARAWASRSLPPWWWTWEVGVVLTAGLSALLMRVHDSGFINVHAPFFWVLALVMGRVMIRWSTSPGPRLMPLVSAALTIQLLWAAAHLDRSALAPTAEDVAAGNRFVQEVARAEGPVLSPFGAWLPTYAGKPPSLHAMGLWDCNFPEGPYYEDLALIDQALETHHWAMILGGPQPMLGDFVRFYDPVKEIVGERDPALNPKSGYIVRPWRVLVPKGD